MVLLTRSPRRAQAALNIALILPVGNPRQNFIQALVC